MATDTRTAAPTQATDANFRLWCVAVDAALLAAGLTAASDTGQINLTTVTRPTTAFSIRGYKVYRFSDSLQATAPVFIKVEFSSGTASTNPMVYFTVGTGSDGAGTITGTSKIPQTGTAPGMTASTTARTMYSAGVAAEGWANFCLWPGKQDAASVGSHSVFLLDRTRDSSGATTGDGLYVIIGYDTVWYASFLDFVNPIAPTAKGINTLWKAGTSVVGTNVYLSPVFPGGSGTGRFFPPSLAAMVYKHADITKNTNITVTAYGATHTYKTMGEWAYGVAATDWGSSPDTEAALAMRFE